ncbi:hypothetical protein BDQ17DRAFT_1492935 [Cyathus striatus]|nr:hypothetical protein BDQ17DRAFT_1492935 [Cyathus striatus]
MPAYISRVCHLSLLLKETGVQVSDDEYIITITTGLPHLYDPFLISLNMLPDSEYTLANVIVCLNNMESWTTTLTRRVFSCHVTIGVAL